MRDEMGNEDKQLCIIMTWHLSFWACPSQAKSSSPSKVISDDHDPDSRCRAVQWCSKVFQIGRESKLTIWCTDYRQQSIEPTKTPTTLFLLALLTDGWPILPSLFHSGCATEAVKKRSIYSYWSLLVVKENFHPFRFQHPKRIEPDLDPIQNVLMRIEK